MTLAAPTNDARVIALPRAFASRDGVPVIDSVSTLAFTRRYFTHCLSCTFCHDQCCSYGVDVDLATHDRLMARAPEIERLTGIPRTQWFRKTLTRDPDLPGGGSLRTRVRDGRCVFHNPGARGCTIHAYALQRGFDYHEIKSIVDCLFPLTWEDRTLCAASEVEDSTLACLDHGPSIYRGAREEVRYYFGDECVHALDLIEQQTLGSRAA